MTSLSITKSPVDPAKTGWISLTQITQLLERVGLAKTSPSAERKIASIDDLASIWQMNRRLTWLVPDLLAEGSVNLISAESGTGKTWFAYFLAGAVARGGTVFGDQVTQRKVLYVDGENPLYLVKARLDDLGIPETPGLKIWGTWQPEPPPKPDHLLIQRFAKEERPLLIWDSLVEFHTGDEQSSTETRRFMRHFRHLADVGATVVILHHTGKAESAQDYRGSSDIKAAVDMAYKLETHGSGKSIAGGLKLRPFKSRLVEMPKTRFLKLVKGTGFELSTTIAQPVNSEPDPVEVVRAIVAVNPGENQTGIVEKARAQGISKHLAEETLKRQDVFRSQRGKGRANLYYLVEQVVPAQEPAETAETPEREAA